MSARRLRPSPISPLRWSAGSPRTWATESAREIQRGTMTDRTLRVLEFSKIRDRLASLTVTAPGRERAARLQPATDVETVRRSLQETADGAALLDDGEVPLRGSSDIREGLRQAQIGAALQPADLLPLRETRAVIGQCKGFVLARRDRVPFLAGVAGGMGTFEALEDAIRRTVADDGSVPDTASPDLARIRREQRAAHTRIREKLEDLIRGPDVRMLQDPLVTTRGDRYVVPVRQEFKGQFPGVLHDQSSSGATVLMEPLAVVPLGNAIRELAIVEREEIIRLLRGLDAQVAAAAEQIGPAYEALGRVDFAVAKALLAQSMRAVPPRVRADGVIRLQHARHPLLAGAGPEPGREEMPIDVWLGDGTAPAGGGALRKPLLEPLPRLGARPAVTTHYNELKALAYMQPGIQNASVEFDVETLRPTYGLMIGVPGRSNALSIAERLGLDAQIVERARDLLGPEVVAIDRVLSDIEADRKAFEYELAEAGRQRQEAGELRTRAEEELDPLRAERRKVGARLREEADALLIHARREVEAITAALRTGSGAQAVQEARTRLRQLAEELSSKAQTEAAPPGEPLAEVRPGQAVYVVPLNRTGTVLSVGDSRSEVEVETGAMRVKVQLSALRSAPAESSLPSIREEARHALRPGGASGSGRADLPRSVPSSLSLRGMKVDDAVSILDKYLDEAFVAGLRRVTIVHGKGTGALRKAVHDFLKAHPHVKGYRLGEKGEGDTGVTIVELNTT